MAKLKTVFSTVRKVLSRVRIADSKIRGGTTKPSMMLLSKVMFVSPPPILRKDSARPMVISTVVYETLSFSLRMAAKKENAITSDTMVSGELAKSTKVNAHVSHQLTSQLNVARMSCLNEVF